MNPPEVPKMLTELSSTCVLEYLSFERRKDIVSQVAGLRKVEKSIPLHLDYLGICLERIRIDEKEYYLRRYNSNDIDLEEFVKWNHRNRNEMSPGDVSFGNENPEVSNEHNAENFADKIELLSEPNYTSLGFLSPIYDNVPIHVAFKKLVFDLVGNRPTIFAKKFELKNTKWEAWSGQDGRNLKIYRLPLAELDRLSCILGSKPLKEFSTRLDDSEILTHPIVRNSEKLVLSNGQVNISNQEINHRNVHLKGYDIQSLMHFMAQWIGRNREIGMEFLGEVSSDMNTDWKKEEFLIKEVMYLEKCDSNGRRVKPDKRFPNTIYSVSLPHGPDTDAETQLSFIRNLSNNHPYQFHLKIRPSGTAIPEWFDSINSESKLQETEIMDFDFDFESLMEPEDEMSPEEEEKMRREAIEKDKEERKRAINARKEREEEAKRISRARIIEENRPKSLKASLEPEGWFPDPPKMDRFKNMLDQIVELFEDGRSEHFAEDMKKIKTPGALLYFVAEKHKKLKLEQYIEKNTEIHHWLVFFEESVIRGLKKMTLIPQETKIDGTGKLFEEMKVKSIRCAARRFDGSKFLEQAIEQRKIREAEWKRIEEETMASVQKLNIQDDGLAQLVKNTAMDHISDRPRDTSPERVHVTLEQAKQLNEMYSNLLCDFLENPADPTDEEEIEGHGESSRHPRRRRRFFGDEEEYDGTVEDLQYLLHPTEQEESFSKLDIWKPSLLSKEHLYAYESSPDFEAPGNATIDFEALGVQRRVATHFGQKPTREQEKEWAEQRDLPKRKRTSKVRFVDYNSPKNQMRLFVRKGNLIDQKESSDSPISDFMDFTLRKGSNECQKCEFPMIGTREGLRGQYVRRVEGYKEVRQQRMTIDTSSFHVGWHGNILGRFWYSRNDGDPRKLEVRLNNGLLDQYTKDELCEHYRPLVSEAKTAFRRYPLFVFHNIGYKATVKGVLILTDWRLVFLDHQCLTNACVQYLPTHAGKGFWKSMTEYVIQLILDATISFHSIIFAFGGAPNFRKSDFTEFFRNLVAYTSTTYDVFWTAQDWLDGLPSTPEEKQKLVDFNNHTKEFFETMNKTGQKNYKWANIRNRPGIPTTNMEWLGNENPATVKTIHLDKLYYCYIRHFVDNCNCYGDTVYFMNNVPFIDDYAYNDSRYPIRQLDYQYDFRRIDNGEGAHLGQEVEDGGEFL
ncbi:hypothetical protein B9Z55_007988 [Caenorhabditis nigoni]|uniref:F-box domain-containing protein n=1 Tax=Caenorhabditis nigoni TaxID=1611254 RepID=A0A2G5VCE3_9PELO|nr:hypothetical protein B9Z55_007988 [Caenorhabditis nigoni]